ncbi:MAG: hypothetical protein ABSC00_08605 [Acidimicrobiales bacterium]|jgi:tetratricopeptide (TPR) repeat protein
MRQDELRGERDVLLASLEDLERERDAGDLSEEDYALLRGRYTARAAEVLRALEETSVPRFPVGNEPPEAASASVPHPGRRSHRRRWMAIVGASAVVVAAASVLLVTRSASSRLPGQTATGSVSLSRQQQLRRDLAQAQALEAQGNAAGALELYHQVLEKDPAQQEALAESGWLEYEAGVQAKDAKLLSQGQSDEEKAERADPSAFSSHLYLGSMLLVEGNAKGAVAQYRSFLADSPPTSVVRSAEPFVERAFKDAGLAPPPMP